MRDHYIPAAVLGRFSLDSTFPVRKRTLWVARRGGKVFRSTAERFGFVHELYDVPSTGVWLPPGKADPGSVDSMISGYEPGLTTVLDDLEAANQLDLKPWLRIAVPFAASIFARGADFGPRFERRGIVRAFERAGGDISSNTNTARIMELNNLLAPVLTARWVVMHHASAEPFTINDLGLMPTVDLGIDQEGFTLPLGNSSTLGIFPQQQRSVAIYRDGGWRAVIEHRRVGGGEVAWFNRQMADCATEWIAGADRELMDKNAGFINDDPPDARVIMERWPFDHETRVAHRSEWHRLVSATGANRSPDELPDLQEIDYEQLGSGWCPPAIVTLNMKELPTGLERAGNILRLSLAKPRNYANHAYPVRSGALGRAGVWR